MGPPTHLLPENDCRALAWAADGGAMRMGGVWRPVATGLR